MTRPERRPTLDPVVEAYKRLDFLGEIAGGGTYAALLPDSAPAGSSS
jgi:hypothetical protein